MSAAQTPAGPARPAGASFGRQTPNLPRLALSISEACDALGISHDFWTEHVAAEVRIVRRGRRKLVAVEELRRWLDANAERALG